MLILIGSTAHIRQRDIKKQRLHCGSLCSKILDSILLLTQDQLLDTNLLKRLSLPSLVLSREIDTKDAGIIFGAAGSFYCRRFTTSLFRPGTDCVVISGGSAAGSAVIFITFCLAFCSSHVFSCLMMPHDLQKVCLPELDLCK
jgi:hypothetical protein